VLAIFANKSDLIEKEEVDEAKVRKYAKSIDADFVRTSARNGNGINETIIKLIKKYINGNKIKKKTIPLYKKENSTKCC
jgi:signal recognition particle receptor subunit beta